MTQTWGCAEDFERKYKDDYHYLQDISKAWLDKYTTIIYSSDNPTPINEFRQPIPDYIRWIETGGELHYFSFEDRNHFYSGPWDDGVGLFIPSRIMEMAFKAIPDPPNDITKLLSLLIYR